jgi:transcription initiation factor TFIIIB Brf1 subunit/transcription initiation factor TFIIB
MFTTTCPWCDETATVDDAADGEFACDDCGIRAVIAPDTHQHQLDRAA